MNVKDHDRVRLLKLTRNHIAAELEHDLNGEKIMKEVWEACASVDEQRVVENEMKEIIAMIRARNA